MWHRKRKITFNFMSSWPLGNTLKDAIWSCFAPLTGCKLTQKMLQPANLKIFRKFHLIFLLLFLNETSKWLKKNIVIYTFVFQKVYFPKIFSKSFAFLFLQQIFFWKSCLTLHLQIYYLLITDQDITWPNRIHVKTNNFMWKHCIAIPYFKNSASLS